MHGSANRLRRGRPFGGVLHPEASCLREREESCAAAILRPPHEYTRHAAAGPWRTHSAHAARRRIRSLLSLPFPSLLLLLSLLPPARRLLPPPATAALTHGPPTAPIPSTPAAAAPRGLSSGTTRRRRRLSLAPAPNSSPGWAARARLSRSRTSASILSLRDQHRNPVSHDYPSPHQKASLVGATGPEPKTPPPQSRQPRPTSISPRSPYPTDRPG